MATNGNPSPRPHGNDPQTCGNRLILPPRPPPPCRSPRRRPLPPPGPPPRTPRPGSGRAPGALGPTPLRRPRPRPLPGASRPQARSWGPGRSPRGSSSGTRSAFTRSSRGAWPGKPPVIPVRRRPSGSRGPPPRRPVLMKNTRSIRSSDTFECAVRHVSTISRSRPRPRGPSPAAPKNESSYPGSRRPGPLARPRSGPGEGEGEGPAPLSPRPRTGPPPPPPRGRRTSSISNAADAHACPRRPLPRPPRRPGPPGPPRRPAAPPPSTALRVIMANTCHIQSTADFAYNVRSVSHADPSRRRSRCLDGPETDGSDGAGGRGRSPHRRGGRGRSARGPGPLLAPRSPSRPTGPPRARPGPPRNPDARRPRRSPRAAGLVISANTCIINNCNDFH